MPSNKITELPQAELLTGDERALVIQNGGLALAPLGGPGGGSVSPATIIDLIDIAAPSRVEWRSTGLQRRSPGVWKAVAENEPRNYFGSTGLEAVMMSPGGDYNSPDWSEGPVDANDARHATLNSTDNATLTQAGAHGDPDLFGGAGGFTKVELATVGGNRQIRWPNLSRAFEAGDRVRFGLLVHGKAAPGGGNKAFSLRPHTISGSASFADIDLAVSEDGTIAEIPGSTQEAIAIDLVDTLAGGEKVYRICGEMAVTGAATYGCEVRVSSVSNFTLYLAPYLHKNPAFPVEPIVPPMTGDGQIMADAIVMGIDAPIEAQDRRAGWGRARITDGIITPSQFASTDPFGLQRRIEVRPSSAAAAVDYLVGSGDGGHDRLALALTDGADLYLGDGQFPTDAIGLPGSGAASLTLRGVHANDPARWPELIGSVLLDDGGAGGVIDRVVIHARTDMIFANPTDSILEIQSHDFQLGEVGVIGSMLRWLPSRFKNEPDDFIIEGEPARDYFGRVTFSPTDSGAFDGARLMVRGAYGGARFSTTSNALTSDYTDCQFLAERCTSDAYFFGLGALSMSSDCSLSAFKFNGVAFDSWQSPREVEVRDNPAGEWVPLSASAYSVADLPERIVLEPAGTFDTDGIEPDDLSRAAIAAPSATMLLVDFATDLVAIDKPGFQWNASPALFESEMSPELTFERRAGDGTLWQRKNAGDIGPTNLDVRLGFQRGAYADAATFNVTNDPAVKNSGPHVDLVQWSTSAGASMSKFDATLIGLQLAAQMHYDARDISTKGPENSRIIGFSQIGNGAYFAGRDQATKISGVLLPQYSSTRTNPSTLSTPRLLADGVNTVVDAANLIIGSTSSIAGAVLIDGATVQPPAVEIAVGSVTDGDDYTSPEADQPGVRPSIYDIFDRSQIEFGMLKRSIGLEDIRFSKYANDVAGFDMNAACRKAAALRARIGRALDAVELPDPTHVCTMTAAAAVPGAYLDLKPFGTNGDSALRGSRFDPIKGGNGKGFFAWDGGRVRVVEQPGAGDTFALVSDAGDIIRAYFE